MARSRKPAPRDDQDNAYALVYSTDAPVASRPSEYCSGCRRVRAECSCRSALQDTPLRPKIRLEKKGRAGKEVTVLASLPPHKGLLEELCSYLKRALGCGGTSYLEDGEGAVELQGDRRTAVALHLKKFQER